MNLWRKVHEADLTASLTIAEIDAFRKSADFASDPVEAQIRQTCAYVRGCIRSGGKLKDAQMHPELDWLPESLISPAMDYLRHKILTRMNLNVNESRTKAYDCACELFNQLRTGGYIPESNTPTDENAKAVSPVFSAPHPPRILD